MIKKYYLQIEIRYSIPRDESLSEDIYQQTCFNKFIHSDLFDTEKECIDYGNSLISKNRWIEQYPGYKGLKMDQRFKLIAPSLKNGAKIFIKPEKLEIYNFEDMNLELQKFNINKILTKL